MSSREASIEPNTDDTIRRIQVVSGTESSLTGGVSSAGFDIAELLADVAVACLTISVRFKS